MPLQRDRAEAGQDGTKRKDHYGSGRQPWDTMVDLGWAPAIAAASIVKYLRRDKDPEHSLESAKWYYAQLYAHSAEEKERYLSGNMVPWTVALSELEAVLHQDELKRLGS